MALYGTWPDNNMPGSISLKSAGAVTTSTNGTAAYAGKGKYLVKLVVSALDVDTANDLYMIKIQANTADATTTWLDVSPKMALGHSTATGDSASDEADTVYWIIDNPYDHQLRVRTIIVGTVTTGINYTCDLIPLMSQN